MMIHRQVANRILAQGMLVTRKIFNMGVEIHCKVVCTQAHILDCMNDNLSARMHGIRTVGQVPKMEGGWCLRNILSVCTLKRVMITPPIRNHAVGKVIKMGADYIGLLVMGVFNASILADSIRSELKCNISVCEVRPACGCGNPWTSGLPGTSLGGIQERRWTDLIKAHHMHCSLVSLFWL